MNVFQKSLLILAPLSPYLMNLPVPDDSVSHWSVGFAAGLGQMADVSRNCDGKVVSIENYDYTDVAAAVRYTAEPFTASVSGGSSTAWMERPQYDPNGPFPTGAWPKLQTKAVAYCVPTIGIDMKYVGLELGYLTTLGGETGLSLGPHREFKDFPVGSIRLGNRSGTNFSAGIARNLPLIAGGGLIDLGVETPLGEKGSRLFFGFGGGTYDGPVLSLKADVKLGDHFTLAPRAGVMFGDAFEYGLSIGGWVRF